MADLNYATLQDQLLITKTANAIASANPTESAKASDDFVAALQTPIRETLLSGPIVNGIYETVVTNGERLEYPVDLLTPGSETEFVAYTIPAEGALPHRIVESDYLMVPTYEIGSDISARLRYIRDAKWPVIRRMMQVLDYGFTKKLNDDGWQTILSAAVDRNILISDPDAAVGQFTPRLLTLMSIFMRRNGGGNSATPNRAKMTDIYMSPEAHQDIRSWGLNLVPDKARENVYYATDGSPDLISIYGTNLHALDEFGEGQEYQTYLNTTLGVSLGSDAEFMIGLDQSANDSFVHNVRTPVEIFEDNTLHRRGMFSLYGRTEIGFAVLDSRRALLATC